MKTFSKYFENSNYPNIPELDREYVTTMPSVDCDVDYVSNRMDYDCLSAVIYWGIKINEQKNRGGISSLQIVVSKVECNIVGDNLDDAGEPVGDPIDENITITDIKVDVDFSRKYDFVNNFSIMPTNLTIDYVGKSCKVYFN